MSLLPKAIDPHMAWPCGPEEDLAAGLVSQAGNRGGNCEDREKQIWQSTHTMFISFLGLL